MNGKKNNSDLNSTHFVSPMDPNADNLLFIAQETLCFYPISTIYNSCPRYLFYALLLATCVTRWTGWVMNIFLGTAAAYAGTAAIQAFIMVSSHQPPQDPGPVTIPYLPANSNLRNDFPSLVTETDHVMISPASLEHSITSEGDFGPHHSFFLNCLLLTYRFLPYRSRIPSAQIVVIWKERNTIWKSFKNEVCDAMRPLSSPGDNGKEPGLTNEKTSVWRRMRHILSRRFLRSFLHVLVDTAILFGILFSMMVSPFTIVAFVGWIEIQISNDGPSEETPRQVGQWAYPTSLALLVISAAILKLKYRLASSVELEREISALKQHLVDLKKMKEARSGSESADQTSK
ncbi:unnamed protein product [Penicillium nalgiovense]|nr:unnamed protein product [Penicillium nalgiovense]